MRNAALTELMSDILYAESGFMYITVVCHAHSAHAVRAATL